MTKMLAKAVEEVMALPDERQDAIATVMVEFMRNERLMESWGLSADQIGEVRAALLEDDNLTDDELEAFLARHG